MKWIAAKVTFDSPDRALATDLVADIFYDLDLKGVVVDDPDMDTEQDWGEDAVPPQKHPASRAILQTRKVRATSAKPSKRRCSGWRASPASTPVLNTPASTSRTGPRPGRSISGRRRSPTRSWSSPPGGSTRPDRKRSSWKSIREWPLAPAPMLPQPCASA